METFLFISGIVAAVLMVISPSTQLVATLKRKTVTGLSIWMLLTLCVGCLIMGSRILVTTKDIPLLISYWFNFIIVGCNIILYFKYNRR
jgi:uncharacterized protein with PQ loop repeat